MKQPSTNRPGSIRLALAVLFVAAAGMLQAGQVTWQGQNAPGGTNWSVGTNWVGGSVPNPGDDIFIPSSIATNHLILDDSAHTIGLLQMNGIVFNIDSFTNTPSANNTLTINTGLIATNSQLFARCPVATVSNQVWRVNASSMATVASVVSGIEFLGFLPGTNPPVQTFTLGGTLTKVGLGNLMFGNNLTVVGNGYDMIIQEGTISFADNFSPNSALPLTCAGPGNIVVSNGAALLWASGTATTNFNVTRQVIVSNNATFGFGGAIGAGLCQSPINWNGNSGGNANMTFSGNSSYSLTISNAPWTGSAAVTLNSISGSGTTYRVRFANGDNSGFSGKLIHNGYPGTGFCPVQFAASSTGSTNAEWSLNNNQAVFEFTNGNTSVQFGALSGANGILRNNNNDGTGATVTVGALGTSTLFGANITDSQAPLSLVKVGNGAWSLSGTNDFTGGFVISNGTVNAQPSDSNTPGLGNGPVSIMTNATLLAYGNSTNCTVTNYGGGTVGCPGNGTWSLGSLVLGTTGSDVTSNQFEVDLGAKVIVTNNNNSLTVNGTSIVNIYGAAPAVGVYDLIQYRGTVQGSPAATGFNGFQLGSLPVGCVATLSNFVGASYSALQLIVTATTVHPVKWIGNVNTNWDTFGAFNWKDLFNNSTVAFTNTFDTVFNDGASNFVVNVSNVQPASVTISNSVAHTYTFGGTGTISGIGYLWKDGPGTAILANSNNTFNGGTTVTNGVLQIGNGGTTGVLPGDPQGVEVRANGTLAFNRSDTNTYSGQITGAGTVKHMGPGTFTLAGDNSAWTGKLLVYGGTYAAGAGGLASFGSLSSPVIVSNGATLDMSDFTLDVKPVTLAGNGAIINSDATYRNRTMVRFITLNGPATIGGDGSWDMITTNTANNAFDPSFAGVDVYLHGNNFPLTKTGSGTVSLFNVGETFLGDITVTNGTLSFSFLSTLGNSAKNLVIYPGAQVTFASVNANNPSPNNLQKNVIMTNATLKCTGTEADLFGTVTLNGTNTFNMEHNSTTAPFYLYSTVTGTGTINKNGAEPMIIVNTASHTGGTTVAGGSIQVDGTLGSGASTVLVTNAATGFSAIAGFLCGIGVIKDAVVVQSGGTVAAGDILGGNTVGILTISNSLTLMPGGTNKMQVYKGGATNDVLKVSGNLALSGTLAVSEITGTPFAAGDIFRLFNAGSYSGSFQNLNPSFPGPGLGWDTTRLTVDGTLKVVVAQAILTNLVITPAGTLTPAFTTNNFSYTTTNTYANSPVTVTAYSPDPSAILQLSLNGGAYVPLTNGVASLPQTLLVPTNNLSVKVTMADNSTNRVYSVNVTLQPNLAPGKLTNSVAGTTMTLSWPADHLGWHLQMQTNALGAGLKTNAWVTIPGTDLVTQTNFNIGRTNPTVFFRMTYP